MLTYDNTRIRLYENFIREVVNGVVARIDRDKLSKENKIFLSKARERFCFDDDKGWKFLTSCLDVIGDSQFAIVAFLNRKNENGRLFITGEHYLIIYGIVTAVYIQQQSIVKLADLFKVGQIEALKSSFKSLDITFLRHCISAHPINYDNRGQKESYKIDRNSVNDKGRLSVIDHSNNAKEYDIFLSIDDYITRAEDCMETISLKLISNCYGTAHKKKKELIEELNKIKGEGQQIHL